ncbi:MAG: hypothetical protein GY874_18650 [Desulfobacteraceae bacterium]|nr:hypothetical protein [Desulfobacteraceae bacterium]
MTDVIKKQAGPMAVMCLCFIFFSMTFTVTPVCGDEEQESETVRVNIERKTLEKVFTNTGDIYHVSDATLIVGTDGKQVSMRDLMAPCQAKVYFDFENGKRKATYIKIISVASDAAWQWVSERPE